MPKCLLALVLATTASAAIGAPIITEATVGSTGNWTYQFDVTNTLGGTNDIYFFGVQSPGSVLSLPPGWILQGEGGPWTNVTFGGSSKVYNDNWFINTASLGVAPGATLGGFSVLDTSANAQTSFNWFAYAYGDNYNGTDHFSDARNPGFEGAIGDVPAVPEPATWAMIIVGFVAVGVAMRRKRIASRASYAV